MKNRGFRGVIGWAALLLLFFTQVAYGEQLGSFVVSGTGNYLYSNSVLTVSSGEVTVSTPNYQTFEVIRLTGGKLILNGVWISTDISSPIEVDGIAEIHLAKGSTNTFTSTKAEAAGIHVTSKSQVTFTGGGTLIAENTIGDYSSSAGIGGQQGAYSCGTIIFDLDGTVTAKGGRRGAGIGTCASQSMGNAVAGAILIKQGTINATGGELASGIGTGSDGSSEGKVTVTIEGGTVTARVKESTWPGADIGSGYNCQTPVDVFLFGGTVNASVGPGGGNASSLNTVIVGPDVAITGTVSSNYTNGFVFSGTSKTAKVKGNPVFPADKKMTIDAGETLTVPNGKTLTNNGSIINNGKIDNNGTINGSGNLSGEGLILGNIPSKWNGNTAYITYSANGGNGTVKKTYHKEESISSFPSTEGLSRKGYTCLGWNNISSATTALESYTVTKGENTLYAVWKLNEINLYSSSETITGTVGEAFTEVDLSPKIKNEVDVLGVTFAVKDGNSLPDGFTLTAEGKLTAPKPTEAKLNETVTVAVTPKNGAQPADLTLTFNIAKGRSTISFNSADYSKTYGEPLVDVLTTKTGSTNEVVLSYYTNEDCTNDESSSQPTDAGTYYVKAEVEGDDNYNAASVKAKFVINKKELIITPDANQFVYKNEADTYVPTYQVGGTVNKEQPAFKGKLSWVEGTGDQNIEVGTLTLVDNDAFKVINYDLKLSSPSVTIKVLSESLADTYTSAAENLATEVAGSATDGWHKASITLTAPADFKLKAVTNLRDASGWEDELVISQEGKYDFKYQLLREGRDEASASDPQTLPIQLDQTIPELKGAPTINNLTATFTLADATSGIASYVYQLDNSTGSSEIIKVDGAPKEHPVQITAAAGQHKINFTIWDVAGNKATISDITFTLNDPVTPPDDNTDWTPDNNPQPVYYNVTLPDIEGASFDRGTGNHEVEAWSDFIFHLSLAEGYKKDSHPIVTTNRGETIAPRQSDGAYVVKQIRSDVNISVTGIIPDNATGIADIDSETRVRAVGRVLHITVPQEAEAYICDMSGRNLPLQKLAPGTNRVNVYSPGIYIVKIIGEKEHKVIVQ